MDIYGSYYLGESLFNYSLFIAKIVDDVCGVCPHHFIAKAQASYLKIAKENLPANELIILLHFAENYSFIV